MLLTDTYYKEITDFLRTVTMKFKPFADIVGKPYMEAKGWTELPDEYNPYYLHLAGEYSDADESITIISVDTQEEIVFQKSIRTEHPKTYLTYKAPSEEYLELISRYPEMLDFINAVLYTDHDVHSIIAADDVAVLSYDSDILCPAEVDSLVFRMKSFIESCVDRWYINTFESEDLYPHAFFSMLWSILPTVLCDQRLHNTHTNNVHDVHIWEFLTSKGLGDYRSVLNRDQAIFLYRNIRYILGNQGKNSNLQILAENLLKNMQVQLVGMTLVEDSTDTVSDCRMYPEFVNQDIATKDSLYQSFQGDISTVGDLHARLYGEGLDQEKNYSQILNDIKTFGEVQQTSFLTKFVELKQKPIENQYEELMMEFSLNTLLYRLSKGLAEFSITITEPSTMTTIVINLKEAIALLQYSIYRSFDDEITEIPTKANLRLPWHIQQPEFDRYFHLYGNRFKVDSWIDYDEFEDSLTFNPFIQYNAEDNMEIIEQQFNIFHRDISRSRGSANTPVVQAYKHLYNQLIDEGEVDLPSLVEDNLYSTWFGNRSEVFDLVSTIEESSSYKSIYSDLGSIIIRAILPFNIDFVAQYADVSELSKDHYKKLKKLFVQLCSYNITFLDTTRVPKEYFFTNQTTFFKQEVEFYTHDLLKSTDLVFKHHFNMQSPQVYEIGGYLGDVVKNNYMFTSDAPMLLTATSTSHSKIYLPLQTNTLINMAEEHHMLKLASETSCIQPELTYEQV